MYVCVYMHAHMHTLMCLCLCTMLVRGRVLSITREEDRGAATQPMMHRTVLQSKESPEPNSEFCVADESFSPSRLL